jgi:hypothetical protein
MEIGALLAAATEFAFEPNVWCDHAASYPRLQQFRRNHLLCVRNVAGSWAITKAKVPYSWDPKRATWVLGTFLLGTRARALELLPRAMAAYEVELVPLLRAEILEWMEERKVEENA